MQWKCKFLYSIIKILKNLREVEMYEQNETV